MDKLEPGKGGELWMADAVDRLVRHSTVIAPPIEGMWLAAGDPLHHLKASIQVAPQREDLRDAVREYLRTLPL